MQNPITFLSTEKSGEVAKPVQSKTSPSSASQFNRMLTKQISKKNNDLADARANKPENRISDKSAPEIAKSSDESIKAQVTKEEEQEKISSLENNSSASAQLIALVGNLGQFPLPQVPADTAAERVQIIDAAIQNAVNVGEKPDLIAVSLKPDQKAQIPVDNDYENAALAAGTSRTPDVTNDTIQKKTDAAYPSLAAQTGADALAASKNKPANEANLITDLKPEIKTEIRANIQTDLKSDLKTDLKTDLTADTKPDLKTGVKAELKTQITESKQEFSVNPAANALSAQSLIQQSTLNANPIHASGASEYLTPKLGTSAWNQAVGQKVIWMVAGGQQTAELTLNPPDLGPLQVVLSVNNDQANANFFSAQPEVREALEAAIPRLRQMMGEAGIQLSGFSVNSNASNGNQFANPTPASPARNDRLAAAKDDSAGITVGNTARVATGDGIVDTYA